MNNGLGENWASSLGLIEVPFFKDLATHDGFHSVLLDGGRGSFALSSSDTTEVDDTTTSWIWSADLPHHVIVDKDHVALSRWDDPASLQRFNRRSVESRLDSFYEFLRLDRVHSKRNIVEHSMDLFRRIRTHVREQQLPDEASVSVFLFIISKMMAGEERVQDATLEYLVSYYDLDRTFLEVYEKFDSETLESLVTHFRSPVGAGALSRLEVRPQLLVRHASGTVFQEAHYEFLRGAGAPTDLFGVPGRADVKVDVRGGTHFTPPGLARSIVEQALGEIDTANLTILDPSCGAGAFLHEVLRYLQRHDYRGEVAIFGYDTSPNAVAMARFTLAQARRDWPEGNVRHVCVERHDSLDTEFVWPEADVILMNPPFVSWGGMNQTQREQVKSILGQTYRGRPDYSMAFIDKALTSVKLGGVVGTLMPASILNLSASLDWRKRLLDQAVPRYLAVLGDYALFPHAMISAAYTIFAKQDKKIDDRLISIWTDEKRGSAGEALRNLRRLGLQELQGSGVTPSTLSTEEDWHVSLKSTAQLRESPNWRPKPDRIEDLLEKIEENTQTRVAEMFQVRQGIRTGLRGAFIISGEEYARLLKKERRYFRPVAENKSIRNGRILPRDYIFYPTTAGIEPIHNEAELQKLLPSYYERFLKPNRDKLRDRQSLRGQNWWHLSESRSWLEEFKPKLISTYFGDAGSFAWDESGEYALVQGFAWLISSSTSWGESVESEEPGNTLETMIDAKALYKAYLALLNSSLFESLLQEYCPRVAGGQYDLSPRYVNHIPIPDLHTLSIDNPDLGSSVRTLAEEGEKIQLDDLGSVSSSNINYLVAKMYRVPLEYWPENK